MFGSLLMVAMHGILSFGSDKNAFVCHWDIWVSLAVLKNRLLIRWWMIWWSKEYRNVCLWR